MRRCCRDGMESAGSSSARTRTKTKCAQSSSLFTRLIDTSRGQYKSLSVQPNERRKRQMGSETAARYRSAPDARDDRSRARHHSLGAWSWDERNQTNSGARTLEIFGLAPGCRRDARIVPVVAASDDIARYEAAWAAGTDPDGDHIYRLVYRIRRASDGAKDGSSQGRFDFEDGRMTRVAGVLRDITENRSAEKLRRTERRLELALGNSHIACRAGSRSALHLDIQSKTRLCGGRRDRQDRFRSHAGQMRGRAGQDQAKRHRQRQTRAGGSEGRRLCQNIEWYEAYVEPLTDASGRSLAISAAAAEISEQKRTQALLREGESGCDCARRGRRRHLN